MNVNLHIEHLILDSVNITPHQINELKAKIILELTRQLTRHEAGSITPITHHRRIINGGSIFASNTLHPETMGRQIGQAVAKGIRK